MARVVRALAAGGQAAVREADAAALLSAALDSAALLSAGRVRLHKIPQIIAVWHELPVVTLPGGSHITSPCGEIGWHRKILLCTWPGRTYHAAGEAQDAWSHRGTGAMTLPARVAQLAVYQAWYRPRYEQTQN